MNNNDIQEENKLFELLKSNKDFVDENNNLLDDKILSAENKKTLISLLLSNEEIKDSFFESINNVLVFKEKEFIKYLKSKNYLEDSWTTFANRIGFSNQKFLNDNVVLDFPYKDCVLEGGQTKDEQKTQERFFNEVLAKNEIQRMFEPKVLTAYEKIDFLNESGKGQVATSNEQRATSNEQRATSNEQRATSNEQRATSNEQSINQILLII